MSTDSITAADEFTAGQIAQTLICRPCSFQCQPLPDGQFGFTVESGKGHIEHVQVTTLREMDPIPLPVTCICCGDTLAVDETRCGNEECPSQLH